MSLVNISTAIDSADCDWPGCARESEREGRCAYHVGRTPYPQRTLEEWADLANSQHKMTIASLAAGLQHAVKAGEALMVIRTMVPYGSWQLWVETNFIGSYENACRYVRIAKNRRQLEEAGITKTTHARQFLSSLDAAQRGRDWHIDDHVKDEVRRLDAAGMAKADIARTLSINRSSVSWILSKRAIEAQQRRATEQRRQESTAAKRALRDKAAKEAGGSIEEIYTRILEDQIVLAAAIEAEGNIEARGALNAALTRLDKVEDDIVRALGTHQDIDTQVAA